MSRVLDHKVCSWVIIDGEGPASIGPASPAADLTAPLANDDSQPVTESAARPASLSHGENPDTGAPSGDTGAGELPAGEPGPGGGVGSGAGGAPD